MHVYVYSIFNSEIGETDGSAVRCHDIDHLEASMASSTPYRRHSALRHRRCSRRPWRRPGRASRCPAPTTSPSAAGSSACSGLSDPPWFFRCLLLLWPHHRRRWIEEGDLGGYFSGSWRRFRGRMAPLPPAPEASLWERISHRILRADNEGQQLVQRALGSSLHLRARARAVDASLD